VTPSVGQAVADSDMEVLQSLLDVGVNLSVLPNWRATLYMILREARKLASAEAGSLYLARSGKLRFVAAQNDRLPASEVSKLFLDKELAGDSLAGFVASTGTVVNIPDSSALPAGAPFRINREFDATTGWRAKSILAVPLRSPDTGQLKCVGVLELFNCLDARGNVVGFPDPEGSGVAALASMAAVTIHNVRLQEQLREAHLNTIMCLSVAAEFRDEDTADHIRRISHSSTLIAEALGLSAEQVELIKFASPMHDIGKIGIPDAILRKPGPLTPQERQIVQTHNWIGAKILGNPQSELMEVAREVALTHHERWDGSGYPQGLSGEAIPVSGRIVGLTDVFDALVSRRCYKEPYPLKESVAIIRDQQGRQFDAVVSKAFLSVLDEVLTAYPTAKA